MHQGKGDLDLALSYYKSAFKINKSIPRLLRHLAECSAHVDSALTAHNAIRESDVTSLDMLGALSQSHAYINFINDHPIDVVERTYADIENLRGTFLSVGTVYERITQALNNKTPFCLIRLGDGEGAWLHMDPTEEIRYSALYERNRNEFWNIWFGEDRKPYQDQFFSAMMALSGVIQDADIIGVPPKDWVHYEYSTANMRGCSGILNAARLALNLASKAEVCSQLIHFELDSGGFFQQLIGERESVGVIGCHPGLPAFIQKQYGVKNVIFLKIPGEPSRRHLLGGDATEGIHFPDRYSELLDYIRGQDFAGTPFLVAGGILGKHYAMELKRAGAIAIDVGSTADKWMGKKTRPNF